MDVAKLRPVEVIAVYQSGDGVIMVTDTNDVGTGVDAVTALENMRRTSPAVIYLDTAEYLIIGPGAEGEVEKIHRELKGSVKLCRFKGNIDLKQVGQYLSVHGNLPYLKQWETGTKLPTITTERNRIKFLENHGNDT